MIRTYQKGDGLRVLVQEVQRLESLEFASCFDEIDAYTLLNDDGFVLAVFGYRLTALYHAEAFALIGKNIGRLGMLELIRFLKCFIPLKMREQNVCSLLVTVKKDFLNGKRLADFLGFSHVAELPCFYLNHDYQLFERKLK